MKGLFDIKREVLIAEEFLGFLGGYDTYQQLLGCFERVGIAMRQEIDEFFSRFNKL